MHASWTRDLGSRKCSGESRESSRVPLLRLTTTITTYIILLVLLTRHGRDKGQAVESRPEFFSPVDSHMHRAHTSEKITHIMSSHVGHFCAIYILRGRVTVISHQQNRITYFYPPFTLGRQTPNLSKCRQRPHDMCQEYTHLSTSNSTPLVRNRKECSCICL
jgi:hypothetical protein